MLALAAALLTVGMVILKPILKLISLPINIITLGIFSWFLDILIVYLVTLILPGFTIKAFDFSGFSYGGFSVPTYRFSDLTAFLVCGFMITFFVKVGEWVAD